MSLSEAGFDLLSGLLQANPDKVSFNHFVPLFYIHRMMVSVT